MKSKMTLAQIAELTGVNASTVSRVLNPRTAHLVSEPVRKKIQGIAVELGYAPQAAARSMACGRSYKLGIILKSLESDLASPHFAPVLDRFSRYAVAHGYLATLLPVGGAPNDQAVLHYIRSNVADAYLIGDNLIGDQSMTELEKRRIPTMIYVSDKEVALPDSRIGVLQRSNLSAYEELFALLRRTGRTAVTVVVAAALERCRRTGLLRRIGDYGLWAEAVLCYEGTMNDFQQKAEVAAFARENGAVLSRARVILTVTDLMALGIEEVLRGTGLRAGRDYALVGYGNIEENPIFGFSGSEFCFAPGRPGDVDRRAACL